MYVNVCLYSIYTRRGEVWHLSKDIKNIIFVDDNIVAGFSREQMAEAHQHDMIQIFFFINEEETIVVDGQSVIGECIWISPNTKHSFSGGEHVRFTMLIDPLCRLGVFLKEQKPAIHFKHVNEVQNKLHTMYEEQTVDSLLCFLDEFYQQIDFHENASHLYDERVEEAIEIIRDRASSNLSVHQIGKEVGLSESRLSHLFKQQTRMTIMRYMVIMKWKAAYLNMLSSKNVTIASMEGGFANPSHFSITNKKFSGIPPKEMCEHSILIEK